VSVVAHTPLTPLRFLERSAAVVPDNHAHSAIARYKAPKAVAFLDELPKTSTGKVPKFELREREWAGQDSKIKG
jgi:acyl-CoA synthetase (AMP-forming)/AMP-acid ligase II